MTLRLTRVRDGSQKVGWTRMTLVAVLAEVCRAHGGCLYDGGAVNRYQFSLSQLSSYDFFHPNVQGQRALAGLTWNAYRR